MKQHPGLIVLLGSGETSASIRKAYNWIFERLNSGIDISILETPAGFEPNSDRVAGQIADFLEHRLQNFQPKITVVPARKRGTALSPNDPDIVAPLLKSNVIMMGPGSPTYTVRQLQNSVTWHTLKARHRLGATLIFSSAATVAISAQALPVYEIYKVGEDLHWKPGLNLLGEFGLSTIFIPHWNNNDGGTDLDTSRCYIGRFRYEKLVKMLPGDRTMVGIDERTALVIDPADAKCYVMGVGNVTIKSGARERFFPSGQTFNISEFGSFHPISAPEDNIPADVWERVLAVDSKTSKHEDANEEPTSELQSLLNKRIVARSRKDWGSADDIRDAIESLGWQVIDSPEGSKLVPMK